MLNLNRLAVVLGGLMLSGCGGSGGGSGGGQPPEARLFNATDGEPTIFASFQNLSSTNLGYSPNAGYGSVTADTRLQRTTVTATIVGSSGPLDTSPGVLLQGGAFYSVYAYGGAFQGYRSMIVPDSQTAPMAGTFGIRASALATRDAAVDVYVLPGSTALSASNRLFGGLDYGTTSSSTNTSQAVDVNGYVMLPVSGGSSYTVSITLPGSTSVIASATVTLNQGSSYSVIVYDSPAGVAAQTSVTVITDRRT